MTENVSSALVCSADKPKKVRRPMPLAHVWPSHRSPSGSGERKLEAMPSSGNAHSLSSCERCYFLNFWAEILHAFPNHPMPNSNHFLAGSITFLGAVDSY